MCYVSKQLGGCGKAQETPVLFTHSHNTPLLACLEELRREKDWEKSVLREVLLRQGREKKD